MLVGLAECVELPLNRYSWKSVSSFFVMSSSEQWLADTTESHHSRQHAANKHIFAKHFKSVQCDRFSETESSGDIAHVLWNLRGSHWFCALFTDILFQSTLIEEGDAWWHSVTSRETDSRTRGSRSGEGGKMRSSVSDARHLQSEFHSCHGHVVSHAQ